MSEYWWLTLTATRRYLKDLIPVSEIMLRKSLLPSIISSHLAARFLDAHGLLALTGAAAALKPTPGSIWKESQRDLWDY